MRIVLYMYLYVCMYVYVFSIEKILDCVPIPGWWLYPIHLGLLVQGEARHHPSAPGSPLK